MPSILFHELIGDKIIKKYKKYDTNNFYLGLMVPDSVNAYGFASKEKRWKTHIRDENLDKWQENIIEFYKKNLGLYEKDYLVGYFIHVLTDIICDKIYQNELYPKLIEKGFDYNSSYSYYEEGIKKFENNNINEKWWTDAQEKFKNADIIPINGMDKKIIQDWIDYTIKKYSKRHYEEPEFITMDFADEVTEKITNLIEKYI